MDIIERSFEYSEYVDATKDAVVIGANDGCNIWMIAQCRRIFAFEPNPGVFEKLCRMRGVYRHLFPLNVGIWSEVKQTVLRVPENDRLASVIYDFQDEAVTTYDVTLVPLDAMGLADEVGFIKIVVEGAEVECLTGCLGTITRNRPVVYLEIDQKTDANLVYAVLNRLDGFEAYRNEQGHLLIVPKD